MCLDILSLTDCTFPDQISVSLGIRLAVKLTQLAWICPNEGIDVHSA